MPAMKSYLCNGDTNLMSSWFPKFRGHFSYPGDYTAVDVETNGLKASDCVICIFGYTKVRNHQPVETVEVALNWPDHADIDQNDFQDRLLKTQAAMERQGKPFHHTWDYLRTHGTDPIAALNQLLQLIEVAEENQEVLVMHNGWRFDVEMIQGSFHNWLQVGWKFHENLVYDSGIVEKASQLDDEMKPLPQDGESLKDFFLRIGGKRVKGVKWALDAHCNDRYDLFRRAGVDIGQAHRAGADSLVLHYLYQSHRAQVLCDPTQAQP